jgi:amino acid transporter
VTNHQPGNAKAATLRRDALGVVGVVFFVVAAAAPLTVVVGVPPIIFGVAGNVAAAAAFVIAGLVLLLFSVGYAAMSKHISGPAGFAVFAERAFGPRFGGATSFLAVLSYSGFLMGIYGFFGYLAAPLLKSQLGLDLPWWVWTLVAVAAAAALGYRDVNMSARVLGVLLLAEVLIVVLLDAAILIRGGADGLSLDGFSLSELFGHSPGVVLLFASASFVGFEATTLYGEEARDRHVTIPRATYVAVLLITGFYVLTFWALGVGYGNDVVGAAQSSPSTFVFDLGDRYLNHTASGVMNWLVLSSVFAAVLAFHNAVSRYFFSLGRNGLGPRRLGVAHDRHQSPHVASLLTSAMAIVIVAVFAILGGDPYLQMYGWFIGVGTVGVLLLYLSGALSVLAFLRRGKRDTRLWHSLVAPVLAAIGLATMVVLAVVNFSTLTGATNEVIKLLWLLPFAACAVGYVVAAARHSGTGAESANVPHDAGEPGINEPSKE